MALNFNFQTALAGAEDNPALVQFLNANKDQLLTMTEQAIEQMVTAYIGGDWATVVQTWFGNPQPAAPGAPGTIVSNTADIAQRQYDAMQRALTVARIAAQIMMSALMAGVVL